MAIISLIATIDSERGISKDGKPPWGLPQTMAGIRDFVVGQSILMGRKTYELFGAIPACRNFVLCSNGFYLATDATIITSPDQITDLIGTDDDTEIFIIGGATLYAQAIEMADKLYLNCINGTFDADLFFPQIKRDDWRTVENIECPAKNEANFSNTYMTLVHNRVDFI
jgi:dihydrofolate reductase